MWVSAVAFVFLRWKLKSRFLCFFLRDAFGARRLAAFVPITSTLVVGTGKPLNGERPPFMFLRCPLVPLGGAGAFTWFMSALHNTTSASILVLFNGERFDGSKMESARFFPSTIDSNGCTMGGKQFSWLRVTCFELVRFGMFS